MDKYDCKKCIHSRTGSVFKRNKKCARCWIDTKNLKGKPSNFESEEELKG